MHTHKNSFGLNFYDNPLYFFLKLLDTYRVAEFMLYDNTLPVM